MLDSNINVVMQRLRINHKTFYSLKHRLKKKEKLSEENMRKMLTKYGFKLIREEQWKEPV